MSTKICNVQECLGIIEEECPEAQMYRGQSRCWPLLPPIGRYLDALQWYDNWQVFHDDLIDQFLRLGNPYFALKPTEEFESWVVAQHHGLPTRLLDTATNPLKALFFAVGNPSEDSHDGILWAFSFSSWRDDLSEGSREYWDKELVPVFPAQIHERVTAQEGAFICYPLPKTNAPLKTIDDMSNDNFVVQKYAIPKSCKKRIRHEISILGAKQHLLFPDLDGVASSIKNSILEMDQD